MLRLVFGLLLMALWVLPAAAQEAPAWVAPPSGSAGPSAFEQPPPPPPPPPAVPVNGALALLALAGGAYAVRRLRTERS